MGLRESLKLRVEGRVDPFYFRSSTEHLFACWHAPLPGRRRGCAVLLSYPLTQEYIRAHRNYRLLACRLASAGLPVLRFDFSGCGDSTGRLNRATVSQWVADLACATEELKRRSGDGVVCLMGLRFGATLAMLAAAERTDIDGLVLWDPIVNGQAYVKDLIGAHEHWLRYADAKPRVRSEDEGLTEIMGFPFGDRLLDDLSRLDLMSMPGRLDARRTLLIESTDQPSTGRALAEHLTRAGRACTYRHIPGPPVWKVIANRGLVAHDVMQSAVSWLGEAQA